MSDTGSKSAAGADDPWEDLAEELFGTTFGKEHTGPQSSPAQAGQTGQQPPERSQTPVQAAAKPGAPRRLDEILFAEDEPEPAERQVEVRNVPAALDAILPPSTDAESHASPQPKPATASPQDSYWDALANWSWDESEGSSAVRAKGRGDRRDRGGRDEGKGPAREAASAKPPEVRTAEAAEPAAAPVWDFESEDEPKTRSAPARRPEPVVSRGAEPAPAVSTGDDEEDDDNDASKPRRRRRRRRGKDEADATPQAAAPVSGQSSAEPGTVPGADWDDSEEELPDVVPPARSVERPAETVRPERRREDQPRREDQTRREDQPRRGDARRGESRSDDGGGDRGRGGNRDASRTERVERRPPSEHKRPVRAERSPEPAEVDAEEEESTDRVASEPGSVGDRDGRRPRRDRERTRKRGSRPEDWSEADWESVEDQVGFDNADDDAETEVAAEGDPEPSVKYEEIPSWEEAISYLLQPDRVAGESGGPRGGPPSSGDSQRRGGRGGRRRR